MYKNNKQWAPNTEALDDYVWTYIPLNESADSIEHHGVKGQKWGVRRYQNRDGSLTPEGMKRYNVIHTKDGRTFYREKNYKQLKVQKIFDGLSEADKIDLPEKIIDPDHTVYEAYRRSSFLTLEGHVTDQDAHPVKGLVVRVGTAEEERGKGDAGYLVRQAIREKPHNDFVAEISPGNETAADFFIDNGFEYVLTENGIDYYRFNAPGDNVDKVMADLSEKRKVRRHEKRISVDVPVTHSDIWNPNELYHHGIKGQKWGVRRFQNPDGSLTEAGKKRKVKYQTEIKVSKQHRLIDRDETASFHIPKYGPFVYGKLAPKNGEDYTIEEGHKFQRVTTEPNEKFKTRMFVSDNFRDYDVQDPNHALYDPWNEDRLQRQMYVTEYTSRKKLLVAGENTVDEILAQYGRKPANNETISFDVYPEMKEFLRENSALKNYSYFVERKPGTFTNNNFMESSGSEITKLVINELQKRGYDAVVDLYDNELRSSVSTSKMSDSAVVMIKDVLEKTGTYKIEDLRSIDYKMPKRNKDNTPIV